MDVLDDVRPDVVLTHAYEGGHSDHDATAFAVHLAAGVMRREGGKAPLSLPNGEVRSFLDDGDELILAARCEAPGAVAIGFGECSGKVLPAR